MSFEHEANSAPKRYLVMTDQLKTIRTVLCFPINWNSIFCNKKLTDKGEKSQANKAKKKELNKLIQHLS